ncbi:unnamed protein product [Macrosiphum euphorbiae]|nr:unnamed protein product [Macrosiphum euphorbiae]CAI6344663.1 unnamed protein product [Macrosiphum euphorbiae]CAI6350505.1 unnamed protein product [Macrosiphum euphorbiae]
MMFSKPLFTERVENVESKFRGVPRLTWARNRKIRIKLYDDFDLRDMWLCDVLKTAIWKRKPKIMLSKPFLINLIINEGSKIVYFRRATQWTW